MLKILTARFAAFLAVWFHPEGVLLTLPFFSPLRALYGVAIFADLRSRSYDNKNEKVKNLSVVTEFSLYSIFGVD